MTYDEAVAVVTGIGARPNPEALAAVVGNIEQTFDGAYLYPTVESRAAHLLYFLIKDHALIDGTKRGAVELFEKYLKQNGRSPPATQAIGNLVREIEAGPANEAHKEAMVAAIVATIV